MIKIYRYINENPRYNIDLPTETIWLPCDQGKESYEYEIKFDSEHPSSTQRHKKGMERNFREYLCSPGGNTTPYMRIKYEEAVTVYFYEFRNIKKFFIENPDVEIVLHRGKLFERTWMD